MSDRTDKKHTGGRDRGTYDSSRAKERDDEKVRYRDKRSALDHKHSHRDKHSHRSSSRRSDDERDVHYIKDSSDYRRHHHHRDNVEAMGKSHQFSESKNISTDPNAAKEISTTAAVRDANFDWEEHRSVLDALFFQDEDVIKKGSVEYDEFWVFLQKYQAFGRKQQAKTNSSVPSMEYSFQPSRFNLPEKYDKRYRVNMSLLSKDVKELLHRKWHDTSGLTEEKVAAFRSILLHYIDFLQKQKFARLVKVKNDQQKLPIYEHHQEIVDAVARHQVVVVAGDTGCGKSTQVPQYLLAAGYTHIACTQPRRIACISLSRRVAYETLNEYGSEVAYQVCIHVACK